MNRNYPIAWRTESEQHGAGPYPASEPEVRNQIDFIVKHKNITGAVSFHTFAATIMRPYDDRSDDEFPAEDLWTYKKIGEEGTKLTGYPNISVFHDFKYHPKSFTTGAFDTWMYDHLGIFAWTVELWSPIRQAGIKNYKYIDWFREHSVKDDLKILKWSDKKLDGKSYVDWYEFDHPQLGKVELGGWDWLHTWTNPPAEFLEDEIKSFPKWLIWHTLISPKLNLREANVTALGDGNDRVRVVVENIGWLPSYVTQKALERKVRGLVCEIELPKDAKLETGKAREELGQLEGRAYKEALLGSEGTSDRLKVEWIVHAPKGGKVKVIARHERAGIVRTELELK